MAGVRPGEVNETLQSLLRINKATQKEGVPNGGVTLTKDLNGGFYTATVIIPVEEIEVDGGTMVRAIDFVETEEPASVQSKTL